jgi:hypothetical protein
VSSANGYTPPQGRMQVKRVAQNTIGPTCSRMIGAVWLGRRFRR